MKLSLKTSLYQPSVSFSAQLRDKLAALCKLLKIDEARIVVEKRAECSPQFRLSAHLVIPGPDIVVESADHTLRAALEKLDDLLHSQVARKRIKRNQRISGRCLKTSPRVCQ
jgi:ribosome-associated translation inhibitor RaiA